MHLLTGFNNWLDNIADGENKGRHNATSNNACLATELMAY